MGWRDFCVGAVAGATLSLARPPAGITIEEWMTPSGVRQGVWRAGALTVIAIGLLCQSKRRVEGRFPAIELACGAAVGFALHGFVLVDMFAIDSQWGWLVALVIALTLMLLLRKEAAPETAALSGDSSSRLVRLSLALCGAGLALAFAALNSRACLLCTGTRDDDTVFGAVALALFALGALAFGPLLASRKLENPLFPVGLALCAALTTYSFDFLWAAGNPNGYDKLLEQFGLNSGLRGTFVYDALIAARVFGLPLLCAGIAFTCSRNSANFVWVLAGAAAASILGKHIGDFGYTTVPFVAAFATMRAAFGVGLVAIGALLAVMIHKPWARRTRVLYCMVPVVCMLGARAMWGVPALPLSPWEKIPPRIEWMRDTPEGLLTIEFQTGRGRIVTLDRRRLTPTTEELAGDATRWKRSVVGLGPTPDAVLVGVLTPERELVLRSMGMNRVFVETPWPELEVELETKLFELAGQTRGLERRPANDRSWETDDVSGGVAAILAPPVQATAYTLSGLDSWDFFLAPRIGWLSAQEKIAQLDWGKDVIVSCGHLDDFAIGVGMGHASTQLTQLLPAGAARPSRSWNRLARLDITQREFNARSRVAERLMLANHDPVMDALHRLCEAQRPSSPFETRAQRTELEPTALDLLRKSALAAEPRGFERELDEFVATTLKEKRDLEGLVAFAQPLADAHPTWVNMQRAAAAADWEFMQWSQAARRLEEVVGRSFPDVQARLWLIEALLRADEAAAALKRADEQLVTQPGHLETLKLRAIAAIRAGDARGAVWLGELLRDHPADARLVPYASAGPLPPLWPPLGIPGELGPTDEH